MEQITERGLAAGAIDVPPASDPFGLLATEAEAMLTRVDTMLPFALHETMVPAATISPWAQYEIERFLSHARQTLRDRIRRYILRVRTVVDDSPAQAQRAFVILRLEFNDILSQFDLFSEVVTQRSEARTGVWLSGLDVAAADALQIDVPGLRVPEVMCYLDRGPGAAIRRARTRLPGGAQNPVAIVRVPRERMVGSGIASSLIHEVGHQGAALLCLVESLRREVRRRPPAASEAERLAWTYWERWLSEIVADFWSVAHVGVGSTLGLMHVVSLPSAFVFRTGNGPHPTPYIRVLLSAAIGSTLFPHPQWSRIGAMWADLYPMTSLTDAQRDLFATLRSTLPEVVDIIANHRSDPLHGRTLTEVLPIADRQPSRLANLHAQWRAEPSAAARLSPTLSFAVIGQAVADAAIAPGEEARLISALLRRWAFERTLNHGLRFDRRRLRRGSASARSIVSWT